MSVNPRETALQALIAYRTREARPEMILSAIAERERMEKRDVALAAHITNGVLQNKALCDYYISAISGRDTAKLDPVVLDILRVSMYQIVFLDRIPAHAAVSEGVELAKKHAPRASGLVNAVLRKAAGRKGNMPTIDAPTAEETIAIEYSHPLWLVKRLSEQYGEECCRMIMAADNTASPVTLVVNTTKASEDDVIASLNEAGAEAEPHPFLEGVVNVTSSGALQNLSVFRDGLVYAQDGAAYMAVLAADPKPGSKVLDTCAAPGGKSFTAAVMMDNEGSITSCDIHEKKLRLIRSGAERLGIDIISTAARDAREDYSEMAGKCDLVICDVPCSGIGVIRKKPEIRYKDQNDIERLPAIQLDILRSASRCVKPGGTLVYSTCTILREENEDVCSEFLAGNDEFTLTPFTLPDPFGKCDGMKTILPHIGGTDGFFICRMKRKS